MKFKIRQMIVALNIVSFTGVSVTLAQQSPANSMRLENLKQHDSKLSQELGVKSNRLLHALQSKGLTLENMSGEQLNDVRQMSHEGVVLVPNAGTIEANEGIVYRIRSNSENMESFVLEAARKNSKRVIATRAFKAEQLTQSMNMQNPEDRAKDNLLRLVRSIRLLQKEVKYKLNSGRAPSNYDSGGMVAVGAILGVVALGFGVGTAHLMSRSKSLASITGLATVGALLAAGYFILVGVGSGYSQND